MSCTPWYRAPRGQYQAVCSVCVGELHTLASNIAYASTLYQPSHSTSRRQRHSVCQYRTRRRESVGQDRKTPSFRLQCTSGSICTRCCCFGCTEIAFFRLFWYQLDGTETFGGVPESLQPLHTRVSWRLGAPYARLAPGPAYGATIREVRA
eukprot:2340537-Rhodomonas_salina.1